MKAKTVVGLLFLVMGIASFVFALLQTPISVPLVSITVGIAVLGALIVPNSGAGAALQTVSVTLAPYVPVFGGRRAGDPQVTTKGVEDDPPGTKPPEP